MDHPSWVLLFSHVLIALCFGIAQPQQFCSNKGTFSVNSNYSNNLNRLLSSLPSSMAENGIFYNATVGQGPDKVYALALCRGDLPSEKCYSCVNATSQAIKQQCPNKKEAIMWTDSICLVRYANRDIFTKMEEIPPFCVSNPNNFSGDFAKFNETLHDLMAKLITQASSGLKFATGYVSFTKPIYGLVQCTPDISERDCEICLQKGMGEMESCSGGREGGRILSPSCIVWFELFRFYEPAGTLDAPVQFPPGPANLSPQPPSPSSPANVSPPNQTRNKNVIIIAVAVASLVTLVTIICALFLWRRMKQKVENDDEMKRLESLEFNFSTLKIATNEFSNDNKLGQGGFGSVYKVWRNWREGTATNLIDETLRGSPVSDVTRCLHIGLLCVQENVSDRPTMAAVVLMLNSHSWSFPSPSRPAFLLDSNTDTGLPPLESDTGTTMQDQSTENPQGTAYLSPDSNSHRLRHAQ
ncbi:hypothetical protein SADUNF_Sadunf10G0038900 [Salix dunnii]|uniref:Gnk2-homologous domain-containing protein n=1 Tax=Salix dunnii TaxID=1413687 RepID=A0A835MR92_9ROSI|nr:hypothetical protein SADUNF_Sadunf10G0038900 [Salix dunnii]